MLGYYKPEIYQALSLRIFSHEYAVRNLLLLKENENYMAQPHFLKIIDHVAWLKTILFVIIDVSKSNDKKCGLGKQFLRRFCNCCSL